MTNYEKIKAMSIDEMAELFDKLNVDCITNFNCPAGEICEKLSRAENINSCVKPFKQWLESECE